MKKTTDKKHVLNIAIARDMWDNNPVIILYFFKIKIASWKYNQVFERIERVELHPWYEAQYKLRKSWKGFATKYLSSK
jgi:hypothetical protein